MLHRIKSLEKNNGISQANSEKDLSSLADYLGIRLPDDYKSFLLSHNGGVPTPSNFPLLNHPENILPIQVFFGIETLIVSVSITWNFQAYKDRIPDKFLPIGCSDFGDLICLVFSEDDYGCVMFWDLTGERGKDNVDNVYRICDSFSKFLDILTDES
ncbi:MULTISPECIES: SMI1/KNR4 family protein [unclassified Microcoleus]|uniref:SMI1/KNR4 family protein n=1 Tax=unclassified Microcoleus TaxID=2642155 RepID=UPI002FD67B47